ncbi:MAG: tetrahydromethanopterin S-methyltransferase subunit F [Methanosphaera sp.]|nr:tetrahydromethanopterin S-methyltransferase subunit F [Methanosphaera sp.]
MMDDIFNNIKTTIDQIDYKCQLIGRNQRLDSAVGSTRFVGIFLGFLVTLIVIGIPIIYYGG